MIGETISNYKILEKLGEGGMGVVYRAEDTRLKRSVALKFLPPHLAASEGDKARFIQEAQAASALNHPNVCTIHDIQEYDGPGGTKQMFIVMEYVEGRTLREATNTVTFKQAVDLGIQIAEGLSAAHEKGIVHRDVKPENVMVRKDGIAQVMDFGLAKLAGGVSRLTREGSTVGTAGYMSPEQVQGLEADHRSDIFSLGVLLYELITGQMPFKGVHETALMYEIVNVDPAPMSSVKPEIDPSLDAVVLECLEKDPRDRYQSAAEVAKDLRKYKRESSRQRASRVSSVRPAMQPSGITPPSGVRDAEGFAPAQTPKTRSSVAPWILSGVLLIVAAAAIAYHFLTPPPPVEKTVMKALIVPPAKTIFNMTNGGHIAVSPDGGSIAFVATDTNGIDRVCVRRIGSLTALSLAGTEGAIYPFWSPDSRKIAFFSRGKLKNVEAAGGPVLTVCDATDGRGGSWNRDGIIIFSPGPFESLYRVSAAGGIPAALTVFDTTRRENSHRWPSFLPDGKHFIYATQTLSAVASENDAIKVGSLDSSVNRVLFPGNSNTVYASGRLLFIRQGTLMAQPFDTTKLEVAGDAVPIAEQVIYSSAYSRGMFSVSQQGVLILQSGENQTQQAAVFDRSGNRTHLITDLNPLGAKFSPDEKRIVFGVVESQSRNGDIWVNDLSRGTSSRFTFNPALDLNPYWSSAGDSIVFSSTRQGVYNLYIKSADGNGEERLLLESNRNKSVNDWARDGRLLTYTSSGDPKTKSDLWLLPLAGDRKPVPFAQTEFNEGGGTFSPDGRWIAYLSDETGRPEIYARLVDGSGGKFQISTSGGRGPRWKLPGQIFFTSMERRVQAAYVRAGAASVTVDSIATLFDFESRNIVGNNLADVSGTARQFLAVLSESKQTSAPITLVVNWDEEMKAK